MTPQDHNKALGIMHLIYGGFNALVMMFVVFFFFFLASMMSSLPTDAEPPQPPDWRDS